MDSPQLVGKRKLKFRWDFAGEVDHYKKDGSYVRLALWRGNCRTCRKLFGIKVPLDCAKPEDASGFALRNCEEHRQVKRSKNGRKGFDALLLRNDAKITP